MGLVECEALLFQRAVCQQNINSDLNGRYLSHLVFVLILERVFGVELQLVQTKTVGQ